nr:hypothetical protein [uncultured Sphingomonas sp.]
MRLALVSVLFFLSSCGQGGETTNDSNAALSAGAAVVGSQWSSGRDRMCLGQESAGLIVYAAEGDTNCTVRGTAERAGGIIRITPNGDQACTIEARGDGGAVVLGEVSPACAYYCGPKSSYAGKRLEPTTEASPAVDLAGDPLC